MNIRNKKCNCGSGLKTKRCHGLEYQRLEQKYMLELREQEQIAHRIDVPTMEFVDAHTAGV